MQDGRESGSPTQQMLLKILRESNLATFIYIILPNAVLATSTSHSNICGKPIIIICSILEQLLLHTYILSMVVSFAYMDHTTRYLTVLIIKTSEHTIVSSQHHCQFHGCAIHHWSQVAFVLLYILLQIMYVENRWFEEKCFLKQYLHFAQDR